MEFTYKDRRKEGETTLRQCQLVQLYILHAIDSICRKHKLTYFLDGGTLIGAMRHNGFIPWDDDLDIGMPRRDYERFLKIAEMELPKNLRLQTPKDTPLCKIPFAKVRDLNSFYYECRQDIKTSDPSGIYIDIFPYDNVPNLPKSILRVLVNVCSSSWKRTRYFYGEMSCNFIKSVCNSIIALFCQFIHLVTACAICVLNKFLPGKYVVACINEGYGFFYETSKMLPPVYHAFEDSDFPVPYDADHILMTQYGDWRQIPPPDKRPRHAKIIDPFHAAS